MSRGSPATVDAQIADLYERDRRRARNIKRPDIALLNYVTFSQAGTIVVRVGGGPILRFPFDVDILAVVATAGTAPTGSSIIVDLNRNGTSIFTAESGLPTILAGETISATVYPPAGFMSPTDDLTCDIDQVGSSTAGEYLTVIVYYQQAPGGGPGGGGAAGFSGGGGGGSGAAASPMITVEEEGVSVGQADTLDFVGAGVTATFAGSQATITIPGGGSVTFDVPVESQMGDVNAAGVDTDAARADHVHDRHDDAILFWSAVTP